MSLESAKEKLPGVPDELVIRSASARAGASGVSTEDVLASWGGGGAVPSGGSAPTESAAPAATETSEPVAQAAPVAVVPTGPTVQVVMVDPVLEEVPVTPVPVSERVRSGTMVGLATGAIAGIIGGALVFGAGAGQMLATEEGPALVFADPGQVRITLGILYALAGMAIALIASALPGRLYRDHRLSRNTLVTAGVGALVGAVFGVVDATMLTSGEPIIGQEPAVATAAVGAFFWTAIIGVALGVVVGIFAQLVGRPEGGEEDEEIRKRLVTAYIVPVALLLSMAAIIVALGTVFLEFLTFAPFIAVVVAGALLTFGFLATARPNMTVKGQDVAVAAVGVAVIVVFLAAVAFQWTAGDDHGEEEGDHGGEEAIVRVG